MASSGKKGGGDFVLESRHLVGLFLMLVVIFGIVFTLGYLLGRTQYDTRLRNAISKPAEVSAAAVPPKPVIAKKETAEVQDPQEASPKSDPNWDFFHATDAKPPEEKLQPATVKSSEQEQTRPVKAVVPVPKSNSKAAAAQKSVSIAKGDYILQIAAVLSEKDALSLAQALQQKKISAFIVKPGPDKYYHVQVGPYADPKAALAARKDLESKGFKPIIKH